MCVFVPRARVLSSAFWSGSAGGQRVALPLWSRSGPWLGGVSGGSRGQFLNIEVLIVFVQAPGL